MSNVLLVHLDMEESFLYTGYALVQHYFSLLLDTNIYLNVTGHFSFSSSKDERKLRVTQNNFACIDGFNLILMHSAKEKN